MAVPVVTIRDVARDAGVAVSTVSRALNGSAPASEAIRQRVMEAAQRLGYQPNATARNLRHSRTMTVGVVVPDLANPVYLQWLRGAEHCLQAADFSLLICDGQGSWALIGAHLARLYERRVDGLLVAGPVPFIQLRPFFRAGIPVEPDPRLLPRRTTPRTAMEEAATLEAYRSLVDFGHRRIAFVTNPARAGDRAAALYGARVERLHFVARQAGFALNPEHLVRAEPEELKAIVRQIAATPNPPTAYVAGAHRLVAPLVSAIHDAGLRMPEDVSFLSFGDSDWASAHRPQLSVIRHDYYGEASQIAEHLLARIADGSDASESASAPSEFIQRESIAVAAKGAPTVGV